MTLVSIIVPARNEEKYIHEAIFSLVNQSYNNIEIVVIDDRSTDSTKNIVQSFSDERIKIINGPGKGFAAAFNAGIFNVSGEIIMQCDGDDRYPQDRVHKQLEWLSEHKEFDAVCGAFCFMDKNGEVISYSTCKKHEGEISEELRQGITRTSLCTFAIRLASLRKVGGMREYFPTSCDIDLQLRFGETNRVFFSPACMYNYRIHDASITHGQLALTKNFYESTARLFQQQRLKRGYDDLQAGTPPTPPESEIAKANTARQHIQELLTGEAWRMYEAGRYKDAIMKGLKLVRNSPFDISSWRHCLFLIIKQFIR